VSRGTGRIVVWVAMILFTIDYLLFTVDY